MSAKKEDSTATVKSVDSIKIKNTKEFSFLPNIRPFYRNAILIICFLFIAFLATLPIMMPALDGQKISMGDMQQVEAAKFKNAEIWRNTGKWPGWSPDIFGGMPSTMVSGFERSNAIANSNAHILFGIFPVEILLVVLGCLFMYILLTCLKVNPLLAAAGGLAYGFMTYSISSLEAGHITKVLAMDALPGFIAGLILLARKKYVWGGVLTALVMCLLICYSHVQITYYAGILAGLFLVVHGIETLIKKEFAHLLKISAIAFIAILAAYLSGSYNLHTQQQYAKGTMRGGSEITAKKTNDVSDHSLKISKSGLDVGYAFAWSYSLDEDLTLMVPRAKGGSGIEKISAPENNNETADTQGKILTSNLYFGNLDFTSGPIYLGAFICTLFLFSIFFAIFLNINGLILTKDKNLFITINLFSIIAVVISLVLAAGRFNPINIWLFNHLPFYNKFRTPMMALSMAQVIVPMYAMYIMQLVVNAKFSKTQFSKILLSTGIISAIIIITLSMGIVGQEYKNKINKKEISENIKSSAKTASPEQIAQYTDDEVRSIVKLRKEYARLDLYRTSLFILLALGLVLLVTKGLIQKPVFYSLVVFLAFIDIISVATRYIYPLSDLDERYQQRPIWEEKTDMPDSGPEPTPGDIQLNNINRFRARVYDLRSSPFNSNYANKTHRNIGGYHPAKLSRYQDVISNCISKDIAKISNEEIMNNPALDMLNCRYVFPPQSDRPVERQTATGNAWFVNNIKQVKNANEAVEAINLLKVKQEAIFQVDDKIKPKNFNYSADSMSKIVQTYFSNDTIKYNCTNSKDGFAVFSEIYYDQAGIGKWVAKIDGKEAPVVRVNHILRGLDVPAGAKNIEFDYVITKNKLWFSMEAIFSWLVLLALIAAIVLTVMNKIPDPAMDEMESI